MAMAKRGMGGGDRAMGALLGDAAGPMGDEAAMGDEEFPVEDEAKGAFLEMAAAIREGDDEAAWEAFQEFRELG